MIIKRAGRINVAKPKLRQRSKRGRKITGQGLIKKGKPGLSIFLYRQPFF